MVLPVSPTRLLSETLRLPAGGGGAAFHAVWGPKEIGLVALEALCPLLRGSARVLWVDACNRFDAYAVGKAAKAQGMSPRGVLARIELARPFNAFQLATMVRESAPRRGALPLVLADPLALFYDPDLPSEDAFDVFEKFRLGVAGLRGPAVALLVEREAPFGRRHFAERLVKGAASVARLSAPPRSSPVPLNRRN